MFSKKIVNGIRKRVENLDGAQQVIEGYQEKIDRFTQAMQEEKALLKQELFDGFEHLEKAGVDIQKAVPEIEKYIDDILN